MEAKIKEKRWDRSLEAGILKEWNKSWQFAFDPKLDRPVYSIDTPPPYVNTPIHIGQATTYVMMDMFARFKRMTGHKIVFPLGLDRNGLPIEMEAEKKFNVKLTELPRVKAIEYCKKILEKSSTASIDSFNRLGVSFNSYKKGNKVGDIYETDSPEYRSLTQDTFIDLYKKGLVYEDERVNNYCPGCQTTLADAEIEYENRAGIYYHIKFKVKETGEDLIIATTRPELVCTIGMIIFNPDDDRYKKLEGKTAISPIYEKEVKIKSHPSADIEKGSGIMMMCSYGDLTDIRFFREMKLEPVIAINRDGRMNKNAGFIEGLSIKEAREKFVSELDAKKLLVKKIPTHNHRTPICERSKDAIEFIAMPEYYVRQVEFKDDMKKIAKKMNFFAPRSRQILLDWINSVSIDWPISRRRFYATEVPVWYCRNCSEVIIPQKGSYHKPWKEKPPIGSTGRKKGKSICSKCNSTEFRGDDRVFDTWFDSSISPLYILKYDRDPKGFFEKNSPCTLRPQGKEIIRTWLYYTVLKDWLLTGKTIFEDVWINYHILDEKGRKMSKRTGNAIDPVDVIDKYGSEPFRLWAAIEGNLDKTDFRCSFERIDGAGKTLTKLWNVSRFISMFPRPKTKPKEISNLDKWIIHEANELVMYSGKQYDSYDFHNPVTRLKNFIWEAFASHYLELVKQRAYNQEGKFSKAEEDSARYTLHYVLDRILLCLAPVTPFITYILFRELRGTDIHLEKFPDTSKDSETGKMKFETDEIMELNSFIWKSKKDKGLSLRSPIKKAVIGEKLKPIESDLKATHGIQNIVYGKKISVEL